MVWTYFTTLQQVLLRFEENVVIRMPFSYYSSPDSSKAGIYLHWIEASTLVNIHKLMIWLGVLMISHIGKLWLYYKNINHILFLIAFRPQHKAKFFPLRHISKFLIRFVQLFYNIRSKGLHKYFNKDLHNIHLINWYKLIELRERNCIIFTRTKYE